MYADLFSIPNIHGNKNRAKRTSSRESLARIEHIININYEKPLKKHKKIGNLMNPKEHHTWK